MPQEIKVRFNTEKDKVDGRLPAWRVLVDGTEHLADHVLIEVPCWTTQDTLAPDKIKWHFSCVGTVIWEDNVCTIKK